MFILQVSFLLIANIIPVIGVVFFDWDASSILKLFWIENVIIGLFFILKILTTNFKDNKVLVNGKQSSFNIKYLLALFFGFHYGLFCIGHLVAIFAILKFSNSGTTLSSTPIASLVYPLIAIIIYHAIEFAESIKARREKISDESLPVIAVYRRIIILHVTILASAGLIIALKLPEISVLALVLFKTLFDLNHLKNSEQSAI